MLSVKRVELGMDDTNGKSWKNVTFKNPVEFDADGCKIIGDGSKERVVTMWPAGEIVNADGTISPTKADANYDEFVEGNYRDTVLKAGEVVQPHDIGKLPPMKVKGSIMVFATTPYLLGGRMQEQFTTVVYDSENGISKANKSLLKGKHNAHVIGQVVSGSVVKFQVQEIAPANESYQAAPAPAPAPLTVAELEAQLRALKLATKTPKVELVTP